MLSVSHVVSIACCGPGLFVKNHPPNTSRSRIPTNTVCAATHHGRLLQVVWCLPAKHVLKGATRKAVPAPEHMAVSRVQGVQAFGGADEQHAAKANGVTVGKCHG